MATIPFDGARRDRYWMVPILRAVVALAGRYALHPARQVTIFLAWTILAEELVEYEQTQAAAAAAAAVRTVATEQEVVAAFYGGD